MHAQWLSRVPLSEIPWTITHQCPLSMEFSRQESWSGLPFLTPGDLPDPETELESLPSPALAGGFFMTEPLGKPLLNEGWSQTFNLQKKQGVCRISLVVQSLRLHTFIAGPMVSIPGCGTKILHAEPPKKKRKKQTITSPPSICKVQ